MKLKVCGMKYEQNILEIAKLQPDYLGFIFHDNSPRLFNETIPKLPSTIAKVGVFVNKTKDYVVDKIREHKLQIVQLHGNESPEYCDKIQSESVEVIKVFSLKDEFNFEVLEAYENSCDYFLFDTKGPLPGGNGYQFDWTLLQGYPSSKPYFLSGGIHPNHLEQINSFYKTKASEYCIALDINSQFEIEPGLKSIEKIKKFKSQL